jgi:hypothetical protein
MKGNSIFSFGILFVVLILIQALIFNHIHFNGYVNPYIYVLFVLLLPIDIRGWLLLVLSFLLGLIVDMFMDTMGMHTAATVFLAFLRPAVIRLISVRSDFEPGTIPSIMDQGFRWVMTYSLLLIFSHHLLLFYIEVFRLSEFLSTLQRVLFSTFFSSVFVILGFFIVGKTYKSGN